MICPANGNDTVINKLIVGSLRLSMSKESSTLLNDNGKLRRQEV